MYRKTGVAVTAAALLLLAGCTGDDSPDGVLPTFSPSASPSPSASEPSEAPSTIGAVQDVVSFGGTVSYPDGLEVTAKPAKSHALPGEQADGSTHPYVFTVEIRNGAKETYDPSQLTVSLRSGGLEVRQILFFSGETLGAPTAPVQPGYAIEFEVAFDLPSTDTSDLILKVSPDQTRGLAYFVPSEEGM